MSNFTPTDDMIECKAIILFYEDEFGNLEWIAENDANGIRAAGDYIGREMDRWENHPEHVKDRFRSRARKALESHTESGATTDQLLSDPGRSVTTSQYAGGEADKAPALHSDDDHPCPVCAQPFKGGDPCATDIELGMCHAACLEGSPVVDLDSGEPSDGPVTTYPYEVDHHG